MGAFISKKTPNSGSVDNGNVRSSILVNKQTNKQTYKTKTKETLRGMNRKVQRFSNGSFISQRLGLKKIRQGSSRVGI